MDITLNAKIEQHIFEKTLNIFTQSSAPLLQAENLGTLTLYDYDIPSMQSGEYKISLEQTINSDTFTKKLNLTVNKPPSLTDNDISHFYPPKGKFGDFAPFLPYIIINRSTYAWETSHYEDNVLDTKTPWIALVVLEADQGNTNILPGNKVEVPTAVIPSVDDLKYLVSASFNSEKVEKNIVISNRFCIPGVTNVVHLIALNEAPENDTYTSLYSWNFTCEEIQVDLFEQLKRLDKGLFRLPYPKNADGTDVKADIQKGFVPLPHRTRNGKRIMSWYRGPLVPNSAFSVTTSPNTYSTIYNADELLRFLVDSKRFDTSYASAWEIGKWLTLQNKTVAIDLFKWKKAIAIYKKRANKIEQPMSLGEEIDVDTDAADGTWSEVKRKIEDLFKVTREEPPMPPSVEKWFKDLLFLRHIPFQYLVPDEQMLPAESIRFFTIDERWIWALIDGALSVGRHPTSQKAPAFNTPFLYISGFILHSEVIEHFPHLKLQAAGFDLIEKRQFSQNLWLFLFRKTDETKAVFEEVSFSLPAEGLKFGCEIEGGNYQKNGEMINFKDPDNLIVKVDNPYDTIKGSSGFAYKMMEGAPQVSFKVNCEKGKS